MRFDPKDPPRRFEVGQHVRVEIADCGTLVLEPDEQVTLTTPGGAEYDVARKDWGFYATPSLNGRLRSLGLRGALVRNELGRLFVFLVERGHEDGFGAYCGAERLALVAWVDDDAAVDALAASAPTGPPGVVCICGGRRFDPVFTWDEPHPREARFPLGEVPYHRELWRCERCGHLRSVHGHDLSSLYEGDYVDATYGGEDGMRRTFERITSLPPHESDNVGRLAYVDAFAVSWFGGSREGRTLLDVGSGLGVFPAAARAAGWDVTALDPDRRAAAHCREVAGRAIHADFTTTPADGIGRHDVVTLNKVLEHVADPVSMLRRTHDVLADGGFVYVELPDGEAAAAVGPDREELTIDHLHVFSAASCAVLVNAAGFRLLTLDRLQEPSTKLTLRGVCMPAR